MKKTLLLLLLFLCCSFNNVFATELVVAEQLEQTDFSIDAERIQKIQSAEVEKEMVSTMVTFNADLVSPEGGESFMKYGLIPYIHFKQIGAGVDITSIPETDFSEIKPFVTVNKGAWYLVGGVATSSADQDFIDAGIWYVDSHFDKKLNVFVDLRNYWDISGNNCDFTDNFVSIAWNVTEKVGIGADLVYDYWWDSGDDWSLIGPLVKYGVNDSVVITTRISREWFNGNEAADVVRVGAQFFY